MSKYISRRQVTPSAIKNFIQGEVHDYTALPSDPYIIVLFRIKNNYFIVTISYRRTSSQDSTDVTFSLTCNATGGSVSSVIWTRDGLLLDNTGPLVLTPTSWR